MSDFKVGDIVEVDTSTRDHEDRWTIARVTRVQGQMINVQYVGEAGDFSEHGGGEFFEDCVRPSPHGRITEAVRRRHGKDRLLQGPQRR